MTEDEKQSKIREIYSNFPQFEKEFHEMERHQDWQKLQKLCQDKIAELKNLVKEVAAPKAFAWEIDEIANRLANRVYNKIGEYKKAIDLIQSRMQETTCNKHLPVFHETLGHSYIGREQLDEAIANSKKSTQYGIQLKDSNLFTFINNTAYYYYKLKDYKKAENEFLFIEKLDPEFIVDPVISATGMEIYDALGNKKRFYKFLDLALGTYYQEVSEIEALDFISKYQNEDEYKSIIKNYEKEQKLLKDWDGNPDTFPQDFNIIWRKFRNEYSHWDELIDNPQKFVFTKFDSAKPHFILGSGNLEYHYALNQLGFTATFFWLTDVKYLEPIAEETQHNLGLLASDPVIKNYVQENYLDSDFINWLPGYRPSSYLKQRLKTYLEKGYRYYSFFTENIREYAKHFQNRYCDSFLEKIQQLKAPISLAKISKKNRSIAGSDWHWKAQCLFMDYIAANLHHKNYFHFMLDEFYHPKFLIVLKHLYEFNRQQWDETDDTHYKEDLDNTMAFYKRVWTNLYKAGMQL